MQKENPFSLAFGREPQDLIERYEITNEIIDNFTALHPSYEAHIITGVRGVGKTVLLSAVANKLKDKKDWIVVNVSPERDIILSISSALEKMHKITSKQIHAELKLGTDMANIQVGRSQVQTDLSVVLEEQLAILKKKGKRLLVTIDEVTGNRYVREFCSLFQIYTRNEYPIFLLMTGLYNNVHEVQNMKSLTFLLRTPSSTLEALNIGTIARRYQKTFELGYDQALKMAKETKGYPYAYQLLGYLCWEKKKGYEEVLDSFDEILEENVYEKIWGELSENDRNVLKGMTISEGTKVEQIRSAIGMSSADFNTYRKRLIKKGIIKATAYGHLEFVLPRFDVYIESQG